MEDLDGATKQYVNALIEEEIQSLGGHEHMLNIYLKRIPDLPSNSSSSSIPPVPLNAVDLTRYELKDKRPNAAEEACVVLEYEYMKQSNLQLLSRFGSDMFSHHTNQLESEALEDEKILEKLKKESETLKKERGTALESYRVQIEEKNEKWGSIAYQAAVLRGALVQRDGSCPI